MDNGNNTVDLLQVRIENAKAKLPIETLNAIAAVDWKAAIISLREKKGYNFEQLGDLELETELVLCGLTTPEEYKKELQNRMRLSQAEVDELVNEMNNLVFKKIKEELIKNSERKKIFEQNNPRENKVLEKAGIEVIRPKAIMNETGVGIPTNTASTEKNEEKITETREELLGKVENPTNTPINQTHSFALQKLLNPIQVPVVKTQHTVESMSKEPKKQDKKQDQEDTKNGYTVDPYRMSPEE